MELRWTDGNLYRARFISMATSLIYQVSSLHQPTLCQWSHRLKDEQARAVDKPQWEWEVGYSPGQSGQPAL